MRLLILAIAAMLAALCVQGCNAILFRSEQDVTVRTSPPGLTAVCEGQSATTPGVLHLTRKAAHSIVIQREGQPLRTVIVKSEEKGLLWVGSFVFNTAAWGWWSVGIGTAIGMSADYAAGYTKGLEKLDVAVDTNGRDDSPLPLPPPDIVTSRPPAPMPPPPARVGGADALDQATARAEFCRTCGRRFDVDAAFCQGCGARR